MFDDALHHLTTEDSFAALAFLLAQPDPAAVLETIDALVRHLYYEANDLPRTVSMARAGAQVALAHAAVASDPDQAAEFKGRAKAFTYNLASYTWPGWDEPGILITPGDLAAGLDAARANLRLARELERDDLPLSRAWWIVGAHHLAADVRDTAHAEAAHAAFIQAAHHARAAQVETEALLSEAYAALIPVLLGGDDGDLRARLAQLAPHEHGAELIQQVETARRVFAGR